MDRDAIGRAKVACRNKEWVQAMLKLIGGTVGVIFLIGLLVVIGVLALIF